PGIGFLTALVIAALATPAAAQQLAPVPGAIPETGTVAVLGSALSAAESDASMAPRTPFGNLEPSTIDRPLRSIQTGLPEWPHHAGPDRYGLPMPFGDAQFERYRESYLSGGGKKWLEAVFARSRTYSSFIRERIRFYGIPEEVFFLPFIESEYSPKAVSKSGAAGLWQFMRNSIGGYDMRIDDWVDERRDFMKSTEGALRKILWNHDRFGDWLLAIAAFNCGAGAMDRAIASAGGVKDYWILRQKKLLPPETMNYIPKFLAVAWSAMHAGRNGIAISWDDPMQWATVIADRPVELGMLALVAGIPPDELKLGNAELRYGITPPDRAYRLKVPVGTEAAVQKALASRDVLMNTYLHVINSGDTVSALARHYGVSVAMIVRLNPGLDPDRVWIGQSIAIPALADRGPYSSPKAFDDELRFGGSYIVRKGDTLWSISLEYGIQPETLAQKNGLSLTSILREGYTLNVPILE
ncbi:MAG: LysM peptidoglycan-binding domain-containing protein, partial [Spirochaetales bacterium]